MEKVYLKDLQPDEVIRRFKAGEVAKNDRFGISYKIIDDILCGIWGDGGVTYNVAIAIDKDELSYFEEPEELKFELGNRYKTRDGHCAIFHYIDKNNNVFPYKFVIVGENHFYATDKDGRRYKDTENRLDIVAGWSDDDGAC